MAQDRKNKSLDFEISFYEGVLKTSPDYVDALLSLAEAYTRQGFYEKGLAADERLAKLCPEDSNVYYNLACSYALLGRLQDSLDTLQKSVRLGYSDLSHMRKDPDLKALHSDSEFRQLAGFDKKA